MRGAFDPRKLQSQLDELNKIAEEPTLWDNKEKAQKIRATEVLDAEQIKSKLSGIKVTISKKVGENGHLFGSVTNAEVAALLLEKGFKIDKHQINAGRIKDLGVHSVEVKVYSGITASIEVDVVPLQENEKA